MSSFKANRLGLLAAGITLAALVLAQGCSSDNTQSTPGGAGESTGGAGGTHAGGGAAGKGGATSGGSTNGGGNAGGAAGSEEMGVGGEAGEAGAGNVSACTDGQPGCFCGAPSTPLQFANHCVTGGCPAHFDFVLTKIGQVQYPTN